VIVDCGVLFPEEHQPGVDLVLPDFEYLRGRWDDVDALILTHAHEDHIGAVPYLLRERSDIPLIGSKLTLALAEAKLREHRITPLTLQVVEGQVERVGPFSCEFVAVNHSIPDALAVALRTDGGQTLLHTGDFKMDQLPLDGRLTDLRAFARLGEAGVDLFLVDSTNAEVPGFVRTEREIEPVLDRVIADATGTVIVACFASHMHRVQQVLDIAERRGRKVAFIGRSMVRNMGVARDLGYLRVPPGLVVDTDTADNLPADDVLFVSTGSQGEPMAALSRMASGDHPVKIVPGDTVVLASSLIPGNENAVFRVINGLTRLGAKVIHQGNALVHVSGHSAAGELTYCYNIVRPRNVLPVHGEPRHLRANGALAVATGVPAERVLLIEDGVVVDLVDSVASITGRVPCGYVYVDGSSIGDVTEASLKDRRVLGSEGFISVVAVVDLTAGSVLAGPDIHARGFLEDTEVFDEVLPQVRSALEAALAEGVSDTYALQQIIRRVVGRWVGGRHRRRPMILPVVVEV
jgi:ribonuclease J